MSDNDGVVYTKRWVVDLMLDAVGYRAANGILGKTLIEPSCGCGAFLLPVAERVIDAFFSAGGSDWFSLADCVRAYDIDQNSVDRCGSALLELFEQRSCPKDAAVSLVSSWLHCGDFLLGGGLLDEPVPQADFVVGNPPYIRATDMPRESRRSYCSCPWLPSMTMGCDLYVGFFDRGLSLLKEGGKLCFICADRWLQNSYGERLRERVSRDFNLATLVRMYGVDAFDDEVDAYPSITLIGTGHGDELHFVNCGPSFCDADIPALRKWVADPSSSVDIDGHVSSCVLDKPTGGGLFPLGDPKAVRFVSRATEELPSIENAGISIGIGIATGCDAVFLTEDPDIVEPSRLMPIFYMRDYRRGKRDRRRYLVNPWNDDGSLIELADYPKTREYFERHREALSKRHVAKRDATAWYRTIDKPKAGLVDRELLLLPDMAALPEPVLSFGRYPHHNCYWVSSDEWDLEVLGGLLMSDAVRDFVDTLGVKMRGGTLRFQAQYLRMLHVPRYSSIKEETRSRLREAFRSGDRDLASSAAAEAYGDGETA